MHRNTVCVVYNSFNMPSRDRNVYTYPFYVGKCCAKRWGGLFVVCVKFQTGGRFVDDTSLLPCAIKN